MRIFAKFLDRFAENKNKEGPLTFVEGKYQKVSIKKAVSVDWVAVKFFIHWSG